MVDLKNQIDNSLQILSESISRTYFYPLKSTVKCYCAKKYKILDGICDDIYRYICSHCILCAGQQDCEIEFQKNVAICWNFLHRMCERFRPVGLMVALLRGRLKSLCIILLWCLWGLRKVLIWSPMMPRSTCTLNGWSFQKFVKISFQLYRKTAR